MRIQRGAFLVLFFWLSVISIFLFSIVLFAQENNHCGQCHPKEENAEADSIHAHQGLTCIDCHGGNAKGGIKATAHGENFSGKIARQDIPQFCARCHSDVRKMNPYGVATDQYAQYLTSKHGEALAQGKTDVATCIDCHQTHGIKQVRDPQSTVYPKNIPSTCGRCHDNKELMGKHGLKATAVGLYKQSVHADFLLNKDDLSAPTCVTCHGSHGATPPGVSDISHVCGKCHIKQQELFLESPHAKPTKDGAFNACITCHSNHKILRTSADILKRCSTCHEAGDKATKERDAIFTLLADSEKSFQETKGKLVQFQHAGLYVEEEELLLEEAKTSLMQLPPIQHTLDGVKVRQLAQAMQGLLSDIQKKLNRKEEIERLKKIVLLPIWIFLIIMAIVFWIKLKRARQLQKEGSK